MLEIFEEWALERIQSLIADFNGLHGFRGFYFFSLKKNIGRVLEFGEVFKFFV